MDAKERINIFIKYKDLPVKKFEELSGLSNGYVASMRKGFGSQKLEGVLKAFPDLNRNWLVYGEGPMLINGKSEQCSDKNREQNNEQNLRGSNTLPLISFDVLAKFPNEDKDGKYLGQCEMYNIPEFIDKGAQFLIRVSGSSMYPTYSNGDILACRKIDEITSFQWGKVYVLDTVQGPLVKRLMEDKNDESNIICHSDNTEQYPDFKLPKTEIRYLSLVVGVYTIMNKDNSIKVYSVLSDGKLKQIIPHKVETETKHRYIFFKRYISYLSGAFSENIIYGRPVIRFDLPHGMVCEEPVSLMLIFIKFMNDGGVDRRYEYEYEMFDVEISDSCFRTFGNNLSFKFERIDKDSFQLSIDNLVKSCTNFGIKIIRSGHQVEDKLNVYDFTAR